MLKLSFSKELKPFKFYLFFFFFGFLTVFMFINLVSAEQNQLLKVVKSGNGSGIVKIESAGAADIFCRTSKNWNSSCGGGYSKDSNITITATPDSGSSFGGWGGACSGTNSVCSISKINSNKEVKVFFSLGGNNNNSSSANTAGFYNLILEKGSGSGKGMIEGAVLETGKTSATNFTCYLKTSDSSCSYKYPNGSSVKLTIVPDSGTKFSLFGDCVGSDTECSIVMNSNKKVIADFVLSEDPAPKINFFYADPKAVKTGGSSILHGQASNTSRCTLTSRDDSSVGAYGWPPILKETEYLALPPYYWRDVSENFTWSTTLNKEKNYNYGLICRGKGSYDNQFEGNGIVRNYVTVEVMNNVTLNVTKSGSGTGTVISNTFSPSFAWSNNGLVAGESRPVGWCYVSDSQPDVRTYTKTYTCNSLTVGQKVRDGDGMGESYGYFMHAFPVYDGLKTATAREYTNSCNLGLRSGGMVNEWQCKDKVLDIDCGTMCSASYVFGESKKITLTAIPNFGSNFNKWSGAICEEGTNNSKTCTFTMDKLIKINAEFSSVGNIPVALWHFEEKSGNGAYIKDSTIYGNDLTPAGTSVVAGFSGNARNLSNKNEYLTLSSPINFPTGSSARTIEFWAKPSSLLNGTGYVFGYGAGAVNQAFGVSVSNGYWVFQGFGGADLNSGVLAEPEKWTYVAVTYDGKFLQMYINGVPAYGDIRSLMTQPSALLLGRTPWDSSSNFLGSIDEFKISVGALTASQILNNYKSYLK